MARPQNKGDGLDEKCTVVIFDVHSSGTRYAAFKKSQKIEIAVHKCMLWWKFWAKISLSKISSSTVKYEMYYINASLPYSQIPINLISLKFRFISFVGWISCILVILLIFKKAHRAIYTTYGSGAPMKIKVMGCTKSLHW